MAQLARGFHDRLPPESERLSAFEAAARAVLARYAFREVRVPTVEALALFSKSTGETSDIVQKEMFVIQPRSAEGGEAEADLLALRPEGTPGVARAYIESGAAQARPRQKWFTIGPMFRRERPQKGRYREFTQVDAEWLGVETPESDAEMIVAAVDILTAAGFASSALSVQLNSLGDKECRPAFREKLAGFLKGVADRLCEDCKRRLAQNPLRALDCKKDGPWLRKEAPRIALCAPCAAHDSRVKACLADAGVAFEENPFLVRGLDYYSRTVFEIVAKDAGAQNAVAGGGRYDGLIELMGATPRPATGWAIGVERAVEALGAKAADGGRGTVIGVATEGPSDRAARDAFALMTALRRALPKAAVTGGYFDRRKDQQIKDADEAGASVILVVGDGPEVAVKSADRGLPGKSAKDRIVAELTDALKG